VSHKGRVEDDRRAWRGAGYPHAAPGVAEIGKYAAQTLCGIELRAINRTKL